MKQLRVSVQKLGRDTTIPEATLRSYLAGQRKPGAENRQFLAQALRVSLETQEETEASMDLALQEAKDHDFHRQLGMESLVLRTMTLSYRPFANGKDLFVDRFFERFFQLSLIKRELVGRHIGFDLRKRLNMLESDEYQIATNLLGTLPRLKQLHFYWMPIRLSIGAVCLRRHARSLAQIGETLAFPNTRRRVPLWPVVVPLEVGAIHVQQSLGFDLQDPAHFVDDLDPVKLANRLREQDEVQGRIACTVTDEMTALAVARQLGDDALIVFPLTTTQSVETSRWRRELPAHVMGAAISRKHTALREYLDDAWTAMLSWEQENLASSYARLYAELKDYVIECLSADPLLGNAGANEVDLRSLGREPRELYVYRIARAYARRVLQLERQSIEYFRHDASPWWKILERARETILVRDAQDRLFVRKRVLQMFEEAFGVGFPTSLSEPQLSNLIPLLEQEFDIALAHRDLALPTQIDSSQFHHTVETLTSSVQRVMERSSAVTVHTNVDEVRPDQETILAELRETLSTELGEIQTSEPESIHGEKCTSFLAVYRGKFVGCLDAHLVDSDRYQLRNLFVQRNLRSQGVGRVLIRRAIEYVSARQGKVILIDLGRVPGGTEDLEQFFQRNGFRRDTRDGSLQYSLLG